jgi:putative FmdB family regulatory protein
MPRYDFKCAKCGAEFEKQMTVAEREKVRLTCPTCKSRSVRPVFSAFFAKTSRKS